MSTLRIHRIALALVMMVAAVSTATVAQAQNEKISVTVGQSVTRTLGATVSTVSLADSKVADVVVAGPRQVLLNGKKIGLTTLVIWYEDNSSEMYDVVVRGPFSDQKIELQVKLAEVNRTKATELGFDFLFTRSDNGTDWTGGTYGGPVSTPSIPLSIFGGAPTEGVTSAFQWLTGGESVSAMVNALMTDGVIHVLAEPNVVASSGQEANFLSGGEIPVPIASSGSQGGSTITVDWKEFGVKVDFVPTIVDKGVINLNVSTEVSSLDFGNGIEISGFRIPALRSRKGKTTVELKDGETLVIGGLLMEEESTVHSKIPLLGHIPLLGALFSNTKSVKTQTELLLVVSPQITRALPPGSQVELPSMHGWRETDSSESTVKQAHQGSSSTDSTTSATGNEAAADTRRRFDEDANGKSK